LKSWVRWFKFLMRRSTAHSLSLEVAEMKMPKLTPLLLLAILSGCATLPTGPSVNVLPAQGKPFEKFMAEDTTCRNWAQQQLGKPAQEGYEENVAKGAVAGTAVGAGVGAAFGAASHHAGAGAAIGAASGLLLGSLVGNDNGAAYGHEAQRRYDNAYLQCMYSYGNQIPGRKVASAAPRPVVPPPPPVAVAPPAPVVMAPPPVAVAPPPPPVMAAEPEAYPPPPEVYFNEAPQFVYSSQMNMYVAVDVPYDLLYNGSEYFYFYGGRWYRSPYYDGPWAYVPRRAYPPVFVSYRIANIRRFRDHEYRRYLRDRAHYDGRVHRPAYRKRIADHR
jgi:hypothetical protein